jgi:hypothetical protein
VDEHEMTDGQSGDGRDDPESPPSDEAPAPAEGPSSDDTPVTAASPSSDDTPVTAASPSADETPATADAFGPDQPPDTLDAPAANQAEAALEPPASVQSPEALASDETPPPSVPSESMTDQESGRAEAEASAEAGIDDSRGTALPGDADDRLPALDLASLHLRLGSLALARSELETFAGRGVLDATARIDLAEVRWRTGDLVGAGEVAREALAGGGEAVVALVIAAEAASALGRPSEARRLAGRALSLKGGPIDPVFAGMPRSSVWPADPAEPVPISSTLFPPERSGLAIESEREEASLAGGDDREVDSAAAATDASPAEAEPGLWDLHEAAALAAGTALPVPSDLDPSALFDAGRAALENGDASSAAVHLGLVVRMAPALAPAVLSLIGEPSDSGLQLVQGDAYRAVGHEAEARRCYAAAIGSASAPTTPSTVEWFEAPSTAEPRAAAWWLESLDESLPPAAWPPTAPPAPEQAHAPAEPESSPGPAEPDLPGPAEPDPLAGATEPHPPAEATEPDASTEASEPSALDHEPGWRYDEGGWRNDDDERRSDG